MICKRCGNVSAMNGICERYGFHFKTFPPFKVDYMSFITEIHCGRKIERREKMDITEKERKKKYMIVLVFYVIMFVLITPFFIEAHNPIPNKTQAGRIIEPIDFIEAMAIYLVSWVMFVSITLMLMYSVFTEKPTKR